MYRARQKITLEYRRLTASLRAEPDFFIVGAQRAGTTSVASYLAAHPQITLALRKEIRYFGRNFHRGMGWYRAHFPFRMTTAPTTYFEASPDYMFLPRAIDRLSATYPQAKLIVLLRNPVERAYSHYKLNLALPHGKENRSFIEAVQTESETITSDWERMQQDPTFWSDIVFYQSYLARGRYAEQIECIFAHVDPSQVHIIQSERFFTTPTTTYTVLIDFLGLDHWLPDDFPATNSTRSENKMGADAYQWLTNYFAPHNEALYTLLGEQYDW